MELKLKGLKANPGFDEIKEYVFHFENSKGLFIENIPKKFLLLVEELGELHEAVYPILRKDLVTELEKIGEELADVIFFTCSLAHLWKVSFLRRPPIKTYQIEQKRKLTDKTEAENEAKQRSCIDELLFDLTSCAGGVADLVLAQESNNVQGAAAELTNMFCIILKLSAILDIDFMTAFANKVLVNEKREWKNSGSLYGGEITKAHDDALAEFLHLSSQIGRLHTTVSRTLPRQKFWVKQDEHKTTSMSIETGDSKMQDEQSSRQSITKNILRYAHNIEDILFSSEHAVQKAEHTQKKTPPEMKFELQGKPVAVKLSKAMVEVGHLAKVIRKKMNMKVDEKSQICDAIKTLHNIYEIIENINNEKHIDAASHLTSDFFESRRSGGNEKKICPLSCLIL